MGREWTCGALSGEPGQSCRVNLRTGRWCDFATGQKGGDAVSLCAAIHRLSQKEAAERYRIIQARGFLRAVVRILPGGSREPVRASVRMLPHEPRPAPTPGPARAPGGLRTDAEALEV